MEDIRLGSTFRALRRHQGLSQSDLARRARVSRACFIKIERGQVGSQPLDRARSVATALGARLDVRPRLPGGDLDRVINADHAVMHEELAAHLDGWEWRPEVTFSIFGERGIIDLLAWHAQSGWWIRKSRPQSWIVAVGSARGSSPTRAGTSAR
jgi:transcriptional regulator with XRE-family HTH domain